MSVPSNSGKPYYAGHAFNQTNIKAWTFKFNILDL
jgi:hypothetical protein